LVTDAALSIDEETYLREIICDDEMSFLPRIEDVSTFENQSVVATGQ
jgi:hypothetical protein